jgi:hypothetical protein
VKVILINRNFYFFCLTELYLGSLGCVKNNLDRSLTAPYVLLTPKHRDRTPAVSDDDDNVVRFPDPAAPVDDTLALLELGGFHAPRGKKNAETRWHEPVDGAVLFDEILAFQDRFCVLPKGLNTITVLWAFSTYAVFGGSLEFSPRLIVTAATEGSGKTTLMRVLATLVCRAAPVSAITPATYLQNTNACRTVLIDQCEDLSGGAKKDLLHFIDVGHNRDMATRETTRIYKGQRYIERHNMFGPVALAGIGDFVGKRTTYSRSFTIHQRPKMPDEATEDFITADQAQSCSDYRSMLLRWTLDNGDNIRDCRPEIDRQLFDNRNRDNVRTILQIADTLSPEIGQRARESLAILLGKDLPGAHQQLLMDLAELFVDPSVRVGTPPHPLVNNRAGKLFIESKDLVQVISEYYPDRDAYQAFDVNKLARLLRNFEIYSDQKKIGGHYGDPRRGYYRADFDDWLLRFGYNATLAPVSDGVEPVTPVTPRKPVDEYMTLPAIAAQCMETTRRMIAEEGIDSADHWWCEPCGGTGSFVRLMPADRRISWDIFPQDEGEFGIIQADYQAQRLDPAKRWVVLTNAPFSKMEPTDKQGGAQTCFQWAAQQDCVVAIGIIAPHWFQRHTVENQLDAMFHRVHREELSPDSFSRDGQKKWAPAIFDVWVRRDYPREPMVVFKHHPDWEFLPKSRIGKANVWMQNWGQNAGDIKHPDNLGRTNDPSWHFFIREIRPGTIDRLKAINWHEAAYATTASPRIYKHEIVSTYIRHYGDPDAPDYAPATPAPLGVQPVTPVTPAVPNSLAVPNSGAQPLKGPLHGSAGSPAVPVYRNAHIVPPGRGDAMRSRRLREAMGEVVHDPAEVRFCCADFWILHRDGETLFAYLDGERKPAVVSFTAPELIASKAGTIQVGKTTLGPMAENDFIRVRSSVNKARRLLTQ